jgi:ElaB/YqjD/DUF883 family membrane-anchored ribosome-binding protein
MLTGATRRSRARARRAAETLNRHPGHVADAEVRILISTVEDLIERLSVAADPGLRRLQAQTQAALASVKNAISEGEGQGREQVRELAVQGRRYVRGHPWTSLGVATLCALAIGSWVGRAVMAE